MLTPGPQDDGSWFVPIHLIRKDQAVMNTRDGGGRRFRGWEYRKRQKQLLEYLKGYPVRMIARIKAQRGTKSRAEVRARKNVELFLRIYHEGYPKSDGVTQLDSLQDTLEGLFYENDWQIRKGVYEEVEYSGITGLQWIITEV